jgi:hypothetical protein
LRNTKILLFVAMHPQIPSIAKPCPQCKVFSVQQSTFEVPSDSILYRFLWNDAGGAVNTGSGSWVREWRKQKGLSRFGRGWMTASALLSTWRSRPDVYIQVVACLAKASSAPKSATLGFSRPCPLIEDGHLGEAQHPKNGPKRPKRRSPNINDAVLLD